MKYYKNGREIKKADFDKAKTFFKKIVRKNFTAANETNFITPPRTRKDKPAIYEAR